MADNWNSYPQSKAVHWPRDEKIIGVLGVAPLATADFFMRCCSRPVHKDWEHPRILIDSNPKIPSRGRCLELGETNPVPFLRAGIAELAARGAQIIAIPCNTAHIFYDHYAIDAPAKLPNIVDVTANSCAAQGCQRTLVLASKLVTQNGLYAIALARHGIQAILPDPAGQNLVAHCIEAVKQHGYNADLADALFCLLRDAGTDSVILGCTELPVLLQNGKEKLDIAVVDSNQALADYCLDWAKGNETLF